MVLFIVTYTDDGPDGFVNISYRVVSDVQRRYFEYSLPSIYTYVLVTLVVRL